MVVVGGEVEEEAEEEVEEEVEEGTGRRMLEGEETQNAKPRLNCQQQG